MKFRKIAGCILILITLICGQGRRMAAQTAVDGAIGGTVKDKQGAVISDATVLVHNDSTNAEQTVKTGCIRAIFACCISRRACLIP